MIIAPRAGRPQLRPRPDNLVAAHRRAWAMLRLSWQRRQAELADAAAADAEREHAIETFRRQLINVSSRAKRMMAANAMRVLIKGRSPDQVRRLEVSRDLA